MKRRWMVRVSWTIAVAVVAPAFAGGGVATAGQTPSTEGPARAGQATAIVKVRVIGDGRVTSTPAGIACTKANTPCEAAFPRGSTVTLAATGETGSPGFFWHVWDPTGPCGTAGPSCSFSLNGTFFEVAPTFVGYNASQPTITGGWRGANFVGRLNVRGTASHAGELRVNVRSGSRTIASFPLSIAAGGEFTRAFVMPRRGFYPGRHTIEIAGHITGRAMPDQRFVLNVTGPPNGVLLRAWVSSIATVTPVKRLPSGSAGATAHFTFAALPRRGRKITTTWRLGRRVLGTRAKPRTTSIISTVLLPGGLPNGSYSCTLKVGGRTVSIVSVRIG